MTSDIPKFPLPLGHVFGWDPNDIAVHDGRENINDSRWLTLWQRRYALLDREGVVTGVYDGPTQRAIINMQRMHGLTVTALLDADTWGTVWSSPSKEDTPATAVRIEAPVEPPESPVEAPEPIEAAMEQPKVKPIPARDLMASQDKPARLGAKVAKSNANRILWRHRGAPDGPEWFTTPGAEGADGVARDKLGLAPNVTQDVYEARLRGLQRIAGLVETGTLDPATAWLLEERTRPL